MTPEGKFKKAFLAKVKKECRPVAILQYKQDSTTVKGFPDSQVILEGACVFIEFKKSKRATATLHMCAALKTQMKF